MAVRLAAVLVALLALLAPAFAYERASGTRSDLAIALAQESASDSAPATCCGGECRCGDACPCASPADDSQDQAPLAPVPTKPAERRFEAPASSGMLATPEARDAGAVSIAPVRRGTPERPAGRELLAQVGRLTI